MTTIDIILICVGIVLSLIGIAGHMYLFLKRRKARSVGTNGGRATEEPLESTKDLLFTALARRLSFLKDKF